VRRSNVQRNAMRAGAERRERPWLRATRRSVAALVAVATVGCGIIELEVEDEDPDGLDPSQELEDAPDDLVEDVEEDTEAEDEAEGDGADDEDADEGG
jgi:hypothetical protein